MSGKAIEVKLRISDGKGKGKGIDPAIMRKVILSTQNRVADTVKTHWSREIGNVLALPIGEIKESIHRYVTLTHAEVVVSSKKGIKLSRFQPKQNLVGTSVLVRKDKGRVMIPHAFMWNAQVWLRKSRSRLPIELLYSTDIEDVAKDTLKIVEPLAQQVFEKELNRNLRFYLG